MTVTVGSTVTWTYIVTNTGNIALSNVTVVDDNGTPGNTADDFTVGTIASLAPGATTTLMATGTAISGQYTNTATASGKDSIGEPVSATAVDNYFGECPMVVNVQRFGIHHQPTQIVVTFDGPLDPAQAENVENYHLFTLGPDGKFSREVPIKSAVYNPATNSVTLTTAHQVNVHHLAEITVTNPCPGGPDFAGVLNRKYSLGGIVGHHGRVWLPPKTDVPGVLNPSILPKVITPANRASVLRLSKKPQSGAFYAANTSTVVSRSRPKAWPWPSSPIALARRITSHILSFRSKKIA